MSGLDERHSVQQPIVDRLVELGWTHVPGEQLGREIEQVFLEADLVAGLCRLNPLIEEEPGRAGEIVKELRALTLAVEDDGLVETNRAMAQWLRGLRTHKFAGLPRHIPVRLIDLEHPANNRLVVADEVTYGTIGRKARFDIVLYVNGIPLVVIECKTAVDRKISWLKGAREVADHYQPGWPAFFVPNVFNVATEGKELAYGATGAPLDFWELWGPARTAPKLADVLESVSSLLAPATVLSLLDDFTLYEEPQDNLGGGLKKLIARYMQYDAVELMAARAHDGVKRRGLIYHTQGTGKTLAMVFAAAKILRDPALENPTIVLIADRVQLVNQMWDQFRTTGMPRLLTPATATDLRAKLGDKDHGGTDQRGLIFSTVHKFAGAPADLNTRRNIVVLVDEAHRTQEGGLGLTMRAALPNALFFAFSGTPLAELDRNTFATFGDPDDPGKALHTYTSDQAIADGVVVPIHVSPRLVRFQLDKDKLDEAFQELAAEENLSEEEADIVSRRASRVGTFFSNPARIEAVCADIVEHFYSTVDPLGMKAQIVVYDRAACVDYHRELTRLLEQRYRAGGPLDEAAVDMTLVGGKDDDKDWDDYKLTESEEEDLLKRFRTFGDPLKFLIVTSKLGTGFNAPIEGVMYLDKPLKKHTLFQTITRTNRTWKNPQTGQEKRYGLVVDYVGLGDGFARAMAPANPEQEQRSIEVDGLIDIFENGLKLAMRRFAGLDVTHVGATTLLQAQQRVPSEDLDDFATEFNMLEGIWEAVAPHTRLLAHKDPYRFLAKVYASLQPSTINDDLVWTRVGAKTLELVHAHMGEVTVDANQLTVVIADADTIRRLEEEGLLPDIQDVEHKSADEVIDTIANRLKKRLAGPNGDHVIYRSLAERLDNLRERTLTAAENSIEWLRELFTVAKDLTAAEKAEDEQGRTGLDLLPNPNIGALTQIFREYAPPETPSMIERVVTDIDSLVSQITAGDRDWLNAQKADRAVRRSVRVVLRKYELHTVDGLFDRAYDYIAEHY